MAVQIEPAHIGGNTNGGLNLQSIVGNIASLRLWSYVRPADADPCPATGSDPDVILSYGVLQPLAPRRSGNAVRVLN
jgi:hypothetical protein